MRRTVLYSVLVSCLASMPVLGIQSEDPKPMLEFRCVGLYSWPVSDADQQMMDAVKLLRERLVDLAGELDLEPFQGQAMLAGWDVLMSDTALSLDANENGIAASLVFVPGSTSSESLYNQVTGFAGMSGLEMDILTPTSSEMMGPMGPIVLGHDDDRLWVSMGEGEQVSMDIPRGDLPNGVTPLMAGRMDIGGLINFFVPDLADMFANEPAMAYNPMMAFIGPDAPVIEFGVGTSDDQMHMTSRMIDAGKHSEALGMSQDVFFEKSDFKRVPKDAVRLAAFQVSISTMLGAIEMAMEEAGSDEYAEFSEELGVDLIDEILGNLGDKLMFYQSESTGGGGLLSAVLLVDLNDAAEFGNAHRKLVDRLNTLAAEEIDGYARVQSWRNSGIDSFTITAPGLPIPFEPSWAIDENTLIVALSPGSLEVAVAQIQLGSNQSIVDNRAFRKSVLSRMPKGKAYAVSYYDAARLSKKGYGMTSLLMSALANSARSPKNPDRVVGSIMPSYASFTKDIEPSATVSWWDGDDFRTHYIGDESMLIQLSTGLGAIADVQGLVVPALAAGVLLPALGQARETANGLVASTQIRVLVQSVILYSSSNNDGYPDSIGQLMELGLAEPELLISPFGPAYDGGKDVTIRKFAEGEFANHMFDYQCIVAIDRAMYVNGIETIAVGFADSHVELLTRGQILEYLEMEVNQGAAESLEIEGF
jgi:hypothetical protein